MWREYQSCFYDTAPKLTVGSPEVSTVCPTPGGLGQSLSIGIIPNHWADKVNIPADGNLLGRRSPSVCAPPGALQQSPAGCPLEWCHGVRKMRVIFQQLETWEVQGVIYRRDKQRCICVSFCIYPFISHSLARLS